MKTISLKTNAIYNGIKQACTVIFPLLSFMYCSRILGAEQLGKYSFGQSIISYFLLISYLGIPNYAIRDGAILQNKKNRFVKFINEVFSLNCIFTIFSYGILFLCLLCFSKLDQYKYVIVIQSLQILLTTFGADWINSIYEDFFYLMVRYVAIQLLCLIGLIVFVKGPEDILIYTFISVMANSGGNLCNYIYLKKRGIILRFTINIDIKRHMPSILILFFNNVASVVYLNSDITMLGLYLNDDQVGVYTVTSKIYSMIKSVINALVMVTVPRFSLYVSSKRMEEYRATLKKISNVLIIALIPTVIGMIMEAKNIIITLAGKEYLKGLNVIRILSFSIIFAVFSCFFSYAILLPNKKEKGFMLATVTAAIINILANIILIPILGINGAAITTLLAEVVVFIICIRLSPQKISFKGDKINFLSCFVGGSAIAIICYICDYVILSNKISLIVSVLISAVVYYTILLMFHNEYLLNIFDVRKILGKKGERK